MARSNAAKADHHLCPAVHSTLRDLIIQTAEGEDSFQRKPLPVYRNRYRCIRLFQQACRPHWFPCRCVIYTTVEMAHKEDIAIWSSCFSIRSSGSLTNTISSTSDPSVLPDSPEFGSIIDLQPFLDHYIHGISRLAIPEHGRSGSPMGSSGSIRFAGTLTAYSLNAWWDSDSYPLNARTTSARSGPGGPGWSSGTLLSLLAWIGAHTPG